MQTPLIGIVRRIIVFIFRFLMVMTLLLLTVLIVSTQLIRYYSKDHLYDHLDSIPANKVGLVLGTSPFLRKDVPNPYFHYRMAAAVRIYQAQKVQYLVVSGDNRTRWYNEPEQMRRELVRLGVPDSVIFLDYAGLRTLDSVVRCKEIFGQDGFTIISQEFHNQRAVYLARSKGMQVVGYNADNVTYRQGIKTRAREWFARVKMFYDLIIHKQPRHLGEGIFIGEKNQ